MTIPRKTINVQTGEMKASKRCHFADQYIKVTLQALLIIGSRIPVISKNSSLQVF